MTEQEFVDAIRLYVTDAAVTDTISLLEKPPGRSPSRELLELSNWFLGLAESDRATLIRLLAFTSETCTFGMLSVLDGVRKIAAPECDPEHFELRHYHAGGVDVLIDERGGVLHELL